MNTCKKGVTADPFSVPNSVLPAAPSSLPRQAGQIHCLPMVSKSQAQKFESWYSYRAAISQSQQYNCLQKALAALF